MSYLLFRFWSRKSQHTTTRGWGRRQPRENIGVDPVPNTFCVSCTVYFWSGLEEGQVLEDVSRMLARGKPHWAVAYCCYSKNTALICLLEMLLATFSTSSCPLSNDVTVSSGASACLLDLSSTLIKGRNCSHPRSLHNCSLWAKQIEEVVRLSLSSGGRSSGRVGSILSDTVPP
jgi:hypothetical protein